MTFGRHILVHRANRVPSARRLAQHVGQLRGLNHDYQMQTLWILHQHSSLLIIEGENRALPDYIQRLKTDSPVKSALDLAQARIEDAALTNAFACLELSDYRIHPNLTQIHAAIQCDALRAHHLMRGFLKQCLQINVYRTAA